MNASQHGPRTQNAGSRRPCSRVRSVLGERGRNEQENSLVKRAAKRGRISGGCGLACSPNRKLQQIRKAWPVTKEAFVPDH